jgi:protein TonB
MPVYASTPGFADRRAHPRALLLIVGAHAALLAAVMTARMDLPEKIARTVTRVELIPQPEPPPPDQPPPPKRQPQPQDQVIDRLPQIVPIPQLDVPQVDRTPIPLPIPNPGDIIGPRVDPQPQPNPTPQPVRVGPRFATPEWALRPPYPDDKRRLEEEAVLRLRLSIDERGRVVSVEPVGSADRSFLEAARRHLVRHWRYKPATEGARPVPSSTVITLTFRLQD